MAVQTIESSCNSIVQKIRASGLNFSCQETPFSIYVTVRKSLTKQFRSNTLNSDRLVHRQEDPHQGPHEVTFAKYDELLAKYEQLEAQKKNVEEALSKSMQELEDIAKKVDSRDDLILELRDQNQNQCHQIQALKVNYTVNEKAVVEETKEMLSYEIKKLQTEIGDLKNAVSLANKDVKILKKEKLKAEHEHVKKSEALEFKINNLHELNSQSQVKRKETDQENQSS